MRSHSTLRAQKSPKWSLGISLFFFMVAGSLVFAQIIASSVTGFVTAPSGAAIPGARVTMEQTQTGFTRTVRGSIFRHRNSSRHMHNHRGKVRLPDKQEIRQGNHPATGRAN